MSIVTLLKRVFAIYVKCTTKNSTGNNRNFLVLLIKLHCLIYQTKQMGTGLDASGAKTF